MLRISVIILGDASKNMIFRFLLATYISVQFLIICFEAKKAYAQISLIEREALIALYNGTNGDMWTDNSGWKEPPLHTDGFAMPGTECDWYGIDCNIEGDTIIMLKLNNNNLNGTIPLEIGNFTNLETLYLYDNQLSESIPPEIGSLNNLTKLSLWGNKLNGDIPEEIGNLSNLIHLILVDNELSGSIPSEIWNMKNLTFLSLSENQFTGTLPSQIQNLTNLDLLALDHNKLSGRVPPEIKNLVNINTLYLENNQLSGNIISEFGSMTDLSYLYLSNNNFTGCIPKEIGNLVNLSNIHISNNMLLGEIPITINNLTNLHDEWSDFKYNHLYTTDADLRDFLNQKQWGGDWENFQTFDTTIPMIEPSAVCGAYTSGNCFESFIDAFSFSENPTAVFVGEGEYKENVTILKVG